MEQNECLCKWKVAWRSRSLARRAVNFAGALRHPIFAAVDFKLHAFVPVRGIRTKRVASKYDHLSRDELMRLLEARDRRDATRFGLVWEANETERDKTINSGFVALELMPEHSVGTAPWRNFIMEGDNFDALRYLRMTHAR
jgi:integrase